MKLDTTNKTHRFVIFLLIAIPMMVIGSVIIITADNSVEKQSKAEQVVKEEVEEPEQSNLQPPEKPPHFSYENDNTYTEEEKNEVKSSTIDKNKITKETLEDSKKVAEQFALAFSNYDAANPDKQFKNVEPYIGYQMQSNWEETPPRYPMTISATKPLSHDTYPVDGGSNYEMAWNVVVELENTLYTGSKSNSEDWIWVYLSKEEDGWKVQRMDVTNG